MSGVSYPGGFSFMNMEIWIISMCKLVALFYLCGLSPTLTLTYSFLVTVLIIKYSCGVASVKIF